MPQDLPVQCNCGTLKGRAIGIDADQGNRVLCYCADCQRFPHALGRAEEVLDADGGSDIFQTTPARLEFLEGQDQLACLHLREGGLFRWYAACCNTPIANTTGSGMPFVGLVGNALRTGTAGGRDRDAALGPVRARVNIGTARRPVEGSARFPIGNLLRFMSMILRARLRGDHKRSPFFDPASGEPRVQPRVLTGEEWEKAEQSRTGSTA